MWRWQNIQHTVFCGQHTDNLHICGVQVLGEVQAAVGQGCSAAGLFAVGDLGSDGAVCGINVDAVDLSESTNAFSELFVDLEAGACEDAFSEQSINATAEVRMPRRCVHVWTTMCCVA